MFTPNTKVDSTEIKVLTVNGKITIKLSRQCRTRTRKDFLIISKHKSQAKNCANIKDKDFCLMDGMWESMDEVSRNGTKYHLQI